MQSSRVTAVKFLSITNTEILSRPVTVNEVGGRGFTWFIKRSICPLFSALDHTFLLDHFSNPVLLVYEISPE